MKTPIGYGKNKFGELKEYFPDDLEDIELCCLENMGIVVRKDYSESYTIYSSKEKFKEDVTKEYSDYISRQQYIIENARKTILTYEQKQIELDRF